MQQDQGGHFHLKKNLVLGSHARHGHISAYVGTIVSLKMLHTAKQASENIQQHL
jgi:hypothetical protein